MIETRSRRRPRIHLRIIVSSSSEFRFSLLRRPVCLASPAMWLKVSKLRITSVHVEIAFPWDSRFSMRLSGWWGFLAAMDKLLFAATSFQL